MNRIPASSAAQSHASSPSRLALALPARWPPAPVSAKTLVFCSEGSPENFYPGVNTTGTSFDANSQIYSRIVDFERGGTKVVPGLAERWDISAGRQGLHLLPAQGRQVAQPSRLQADARLQRRRHHLRPRAPVEGSQPLFQGHELEPLVLQRHGHGEAAQVGGEGRRLHGQDHAEQARGAVPVGPGDGIRRRPVEGIRRRHAEGRHAREDRPGADRHRPVLPGAVPEGRGHPLQGVSRSTGAARPRSTTWSSRSRRTPRCAGPSCKRANAT